MKRIKAWWAGRKLVRDSKIHVLASRKTTLPLEQCNAENLRAAARYNERRAKVHARSRHKQNHAAHMQWNEIAALTLFALADQLKDGQLVSDLPPRKRKKHVETLLRIEKGRAA